MLSKSLLFLTTAALAVAAPPAGRGHGRGGSCKPSSTSAAPPTNTNVVDPPTPEEPQLPEHGGGIELTAPADGQVLKHVVLGHGYQNYTCADSTSSPGTLEASSTGALAVLYDISSYYPGHENGLADFDAWLSIAATAAFTLDPPLILADPAVTQGRSVGAEPQVNLAAPFADPLAPITVSSTIALSPIGVHYFDGNGVPTFDVGDDLFKAKKINATAAPDDASPGQNGEKAVSWLYLGDAGGSIGLTNVYRVNTVGGSGHACANLGDTDSTEYTAFYYLYE